MITTTNNSQAVQAYQGKQCAEMPQQDLLPEILNQYKMVCAYAGQQVTSDQHSLNLIVRMIEADLKKTRCTLEQFKIAVNEGMRSGEVYSANAPATYLKWVCVYLDKVKMELAAHRNNQSFQPYEMSEEEKLNTAIEHLVTMYHKFKKGQSFLDGGSAGYLWLEKIGQINVSIDEKAEMFEKSKDRAIAAIKAKRDNAERYEARTIQSLLNAIEQRPKDVPELRFEQIKICRDDLLRQYFRENNLTHDFLYEIFQEHQAK
jgi:hypothetical protein